MSLLVKRSSFSKSFSAAQKIIEISGQMNLTEKQLLDAIELVRFIHEKEATAAMAAETSKHAFGDSDGHVPCGKKTENLFTD